MTAGNVMRSYLGIVVSLIALTSCSTSKIPASLHASTVNDEISAGLLGNWEQLGIQKGQPVPNFTLYSEKGKAFDLSSELKKGRPIVLISVSYTCDVSRNNIGAIKEFQQQYRKQANFFLVYTIDAHPFDVASPYSPDGEIWVAKNNVRDNVKAAQPRTYKQRTELATKWKVENALDFTVLVDTPDNFYWKKFGQAPNMVYIISPSQEVFYKQAWFNKQKLAQQLETLRDSELD